MKNTHVGLLVGFALLGGILVTGCNKTPQDGLAKALKSRVSSHSLERLSGLEAEDTVVVSIHHGDQPKPKVAVGAARSLGFELNIALLDVPVASAMELADTPKDQEVVVWGSGRAVRKLDPMLRQSLMRLLATESWRETMVDAIASFDDGETDLAADLTARGVTYRSLQGGIATLSLTPESMFDLLAYPALRQLSMPKIQQPSTGH